MSEEAFVQAIFDAAFQDGDISAERKRALWVGGITSPVMDDRIKGGIADREKPSAEIAAVRRYFSGIPTLGFWRDNHTVKVIGLPIELKGRTNVKSKVRC
jgi:hypothetical protein